MKEPFFLNPDDFQVELLDGLCFLPREGLGAKIDLILHVFLADILADLPELFLKL